MAAWFEAITIDWQRPWWHTYRDIGADTWRLIQAGQPVHAALNAGRDHGALPTFAPADDAPTTTPYELHVHRTGRVPTRDNLHDFFNGLVWLCHPGCKARLNALQASHIEQHGVQGKRGPLRDALTLFDESGAVVQLPSNTARALQARAWREAFVTQHQAWTAHSVVVVGHALLEQLTMAPRKGLTAHALLTDPLGLSAAQWASKPFAALPVMGVPAWAADQTAAFYADAAVFRPPTAGQP